MKINNVVVIGAGLMGSGIAQVSLQKGYQVTLVDIKDEFIDKGVSGIKKSLKKMEDRGKLGEGITSELILAKLKTTTDLASAVKDADIIIEAVIEKMDIKQNVFNICTENSPNHCILGTNTSSMSISEIAQNSTRADKCVGIHFFNPVPLMGLVEVIAGDATSEETMDIAIQWAGDLPCRTKRFVAKVLKDRPGFLANRMAAPAFVLMNWAYDQALEKEISWELLNADTKKENSPMGYLELADYVGHDTYYHINNYFAETLSLDFKPGKVYSDLYNNKDLGRKTGKGFFDWSKGKPKLKYDTKSGIVNAEILDAIEANEGCRLLEEGVVKNWQVIDDTMVAGFNRPGVMSIACEKFKDWSKLLEDLSKKIDKSYLSPCNYLKSGKFIEMK